MLLSPKLLLVRPFDVSFDADELERLLLKVKLLSVCRHLDNDMGNGVAPHLLLQTTGGEIVARLEDVVMNGGDVRLMTLRATQYFFVIEETIGGGFQARQALYAITADLSEDEIAEVNLVGFVGD